MQKVNSDLVGKVVNIASRCAGFIHKGNAGVLVGADPAPELLAAFREAARASPRPMRPATSNRAMREIMALADRANAWIAEQAPWALAKQEGQQDKVQAVCGLGINLFRQLVIFPQAGAAEAGRRRRSLPQRRPADLGRPPDPAGQPPVEPVPAPDDPYRARESRSHDRSLQGRPRRRIPTRRQRRAGQGTHRRGDRLRRFSPRSTCASP